MNNGPVIMAECPGHCLPGPSLCVCCVSLFDFTIGREKGEDGRMNEELRRRGSKRGVLKWSHVTWYFACCELFRSRGDTDRYESLNLPQEQHFPVLTRCKSGFPGTFMKCLSWEESSAKQSQSMALCHSQDRLC